MVELPSTTRWTRRKEARPNEILEAALDLFVERGYAGTKMEEIAKRAGVTRGTPYLYFANKEELFKAVISEGMLPSIEVGEGMLRDFTGSAMDLIEQTLNFWWAAVGKTRLAGITKLIVAEACNFPDIARFYCEEVVRRGEALVAGAIDYGIQRGEFRALDVEYTMKVIIGPVLMAMIWQHSVGACVHEAFDEERFLRTYMELLRHGLLRNEQHPPI